MASEPSDEMLSAAKEAFDNADEIARLEDVFADILVADGRTGISRLLNDLSNATSTALRAAEARGYERAREQAAEMLHNLGPATQDTTSTMICEALDQAAAIIAAMQPSIGHAGSSRS